MNKPENPKSIWAYVTCIPYRRLEAGTVPDALEQDVRDGVIATVSEYVRADTARGQLEAEVARLRAALDQIASLQLGEPDGDHTDGNLDYAYELGYARGCFAVSTLARAALDGVR